MSVRELENIQAFILQVFGPWLVYFQALLIAGSVLLAALFPFLTLLRIMTRRR